MDDKTIAKIAEIEAPVAGNVLRPTVFNRPSAARQRITQMPTGAPQPASPQPLPFSAPPSQPPPVLDIYDADALLAKPTPQRRWCVDRGCRRLRRHCAPATVATA